MTTTDLETRVRVLEDLDAIRALKARYFFCCDQKDPQGMRACFAPGLVSIDYGVIGVFTDRDQLVDVFTRLGCHDHIIEMHHGVNPQIEVIDATHARGTWGLYYQQINTQERKTTQLGACYEDEYRKIDGVWTISKTRCVVTSTLVSALTDESAGIASASRAAPAAAINQPVRREHAHEHALRKTSLTWMFALLAVLICIGFFLLDEHFFPSAVRSADDLSMIAHYSAGRCLDDHRYCTPPTFGWEVLGR